MKIDLTNIPPDGKYIEFNFGVDWWKLDFENDHILGLSRPLSGSITLHYLGKKVAIKGTLSTTLRLRCDRCLEPFDKQLEKEFKYYLSMTPYVGDLDIELSEEDLNLTFVDGYYLCADEIIREQILLSIPMKTVCSAHCKGLCPVCGCNLNFETCSCAEKLHITNKKGN